MLSVSRIALVDACTRDGRGGSPTAVLVDDPTVSDAGRREIVVRTGASHGAFIDPEAGGATTIRFFSAGGELRNCGHGTIAAQAVMLELSGSARRRAQQLTGGRTFDTIAMRRDDGIEVWFDQGAIDLNQPTRDQRDGMLAGAAAATSGSSKATHWAGPRWSMPPRPRAMLGSRPESVVLLSSDVG